MVRRWIKRDWPTLGQARSSLPTKPSCLPTCPGLQPNHSQTGGWERWLRPLPLPLLPWLLAWSLPLLSRKSWPWRPVPHLSALAQRAWLFCQFSFPSLPSGPSRHRPARPVFFLFPSRPAPSCFSSPSYLLSCPASLFFQLSLWPSLSCVSSFLSSPFPFFCLSSSISLIFSLLGPQNVSATLAPSAEKKPSKPQPLTFCGIARRKALIASTHVVA